MRTVALTVLLLFYFVYPELGKYVYENNNTIHVSAKEVLTSRSSTVSARTLRRWAKRGK